MDQIPHKKIVRDISEHKNPVIQKLYNECFPMIERMVINSGGNHEQAQDVFQEGWMVICRKINREELDLCCKFSTYIYAVCKRIWAQEKRKNNSRMNHLMSEPMVVEDNEPGLEIEEESGHIKMFNKHFAQLSEDCQKILRLHFNEVPIEEIQKIMNYQNAHYTMDRKYRCKKSLITRIINDPNYKSVKNEYTEQIRSLY